MRGIELRRRDSPNLIKNLQRDILTHSWFIMKPPRSASKSFEAVLNFSGLFFFHSIKTPLYGLEVVACLK